MDSSTVMLHESICHFRGVRSIFLLLFNFSMEIIIGNNVDPDQTPHHVAPDVGLLCLPMTLLRVSWLELVKRNIQAKSFGSRPHKSFCCCCCIVVLRPR